jgi:acyl carrier protein
MRTCIGGNPRDKGGRWEMDPIAMNDEAFFLPKEKQCAALDFMEEAPAEVRTMLSPIWKWNFVQWMIYDAGYEAKKSGTSLAELLGSKEMITDIQALLSFCESGGLEKSKKSEKWTWRMLERLPAAGSTELDMGDDNSPLVQAAREERSEGCDAWNVQRYDKAFWHFSQGIRHLCRLPEPLSPVQCKLGSDLYKNIAATALELNMNRIALNCSTSAINLFPNDQKAWFRKARALQALDQDEEATVAFLYAGYSEVEKELGPAVEPPPEGSDIDDAMKAAIEKLVFTDCGLDSMDSVELISLIQDHLPLYKIPQDLVFRCPTVADARDFLVENAKSEDKATVDTIYRSMCKVMNRDVLKVKSPKQMLPEEKALGALLTLIENYSAPSYLAKVQEIAGRVNHEYKPFLVNLRRHALEVQIQCLEIRGFPPTYEGMRRFEGSLINAARQSKQVKELLQEARRACYGGQDGMWPVVMEGAKPKKK